MPPRFRQLIERYPQLEPLLPDLLAAFAAIAASYAAGGQLLLCGNGGSAADADHISGELLKGFGQKRPLGPGEVAAYGPALAGKLQGALPALPLTVFHALLTAWANDCDPAYAYAQLVHGLGRRGDVLLAISTSGNAHNVRHAATVARAKGLVVVGLTGASGGALRELCDHCLRVPETETFKIQELHLPIYHALCLALEEHFFPTPPPTPVGP